MKLSKRSKIAVNALRHYLGKPLRTDKASDVLQLIEKIKRADNFNLKIDANEKQILQNALNNYLKRFLRMDSAIDVSELIIIIKNYTPIQVSTSSSPPHGSLGDKWTKNVI